MQGSMKKLSLAFGIVGLGLVVGVGCGGGDDVGLTGGQAVGGSGSGTGGASSGTTTASGGGSSTGTGGEGGTSATTTTSSSSGTGGGGGNPMSVSDPNKDGPYQPGIIEDATFTVPVTNEKAPIHCEYPASGPSAGPYPVVLIAHGFQLPAKQYYGYARRLATHGYVALTVDFPTSFTGTNNTTATQDILAGLDWVKGKPELKGNTDLAGATGHSLGGKLAMHATVVDPRIKASIVLDPVDGGGSPFGGGCNPPQCLDVSAELPVTKPTGFLGETLDATAGFGGQACAPQAENFLQFYAKTTAPSFAATVNGANHMSFLDDVSSCGFTCNVCQMATLDNATVNDLSKAYVVAFYERYLRGNTAYDTYLTGADAKVRYFDTGLVSIQTK